MVIGVLVPFERKDEVPSQEYHPGLTYEAYEMHPLRKLYDARTDSFLCWDPEQKENVLIKHSFVERNVLPMCSQVLVKVWSLCMRKLINHIAYKPSGRSRKEEDTGEDEEEKLRKMMEHDQVYVMGKIVPPRACSNDYEKCVWISIEVRHTVGNLKNIPFADMITIQVPPEDLRPMIQEAQYTSEANSAGTKSVTKYIKKKKKRKATKHKNSTKTKHHDNGGGNSQADDDDDDENDDNDDDNDDETSIIISRFIYANKVNDSL